MLARQKWGGGWGWGIRPEFTTNLTVDEAAPQGQTSLLFYSVKRKHKKIYFVRSCVQHVYMAALVQCTCTSIRSFNWTTVLVPVNKWGRGINLILQKDVLALADGNMSPIILLV